MKRPAIDEATKAEIQKLVGALPPPSRSRFSSLILKIAAGYAAMALFTIAALALAFFNLSLLNDTARRVANVELPALNALINMRSSLLAQERYAGKYAILKDATFVELFRQRQQASLANLAVLEAAGSRDEVSSIKRLYLDYQEASEHLFANRSGNRSELQAAALRLLTALDSLYMKRQRKIQDALLQAEEIRRSTIRSTIVISCAGFILALWVAPFIIYRLFSALGKLQKETHRVASGDLNYAPQVPVVEELTDLASDFNLMAAKIKEMEQMSLDAQPLSRLPGNAAIERVIGERLREGTPFALCTIRVEKVAGFTARYGYARTSDLLSATGALIYAAVKEFGGAADFAGHVGGAEFVMLLSKERVNQVCQAVEESFAVEAENHVTPEESLSAAAPALSISVLHCADGRYASAVEVARAALNAAAGGNEREAGAVTV